LFFPSQPGRILQARQNFASQNFCLGSRERFGTEQNQIPEFPHAYSFPWVDLNWKACILLSEKILILSTFSHSMLNLHVKLSLNMRGGGII
jgi:hypothetical protein